VSSLGFQLVSTAPGGRGERERERHYIRNRIHNVTSDATDASTDNKKKRREKKRKSREKEKKKEKQKKREKKRKGKKKKMSASPRNWLKESPTSDATDASTDWRRKESTGSSVLSMRARLL